MSRDSVMRADTEIGGLISKRNEILKSIANKIALLATDKMKDGENVSPQTISNLVKDLSFEEQAIIYPMVISAIIKSQMNDNSSKKRNNNYNSNDLFKGRGF